ncbi:branched-chain amino acid ABC transporter permease [Pseudactinotalea sp. HY160]|uniref:AzlC family ABC transporter permease n=1 Tax=Pseudactinotalea sp. HY160 TaxID=2654490 RepID=UPI00128D58D2|nr:AzlC family ABC transporter permease [Pseudactinotalea sp. HY160]MPV50562.1 branched-chain amino acid ABC transporter permease [Pseudactinotalea sp. HY160]
MGAAAGRRDVDTIRAVVLLGCAMALVGVAYGAMTVGVGLPVWVAPVLGVIVLAGSSEMLYVGLATATSPWLALPAALLVNVRHVPYGMAVRRYLGHGRTRAWRSHVMNDESVAFALAEREPERAKRTYGLAGIAVLISWPTGAFVGGLLGRGIDQEAFGLDAIFPAVILALVLPALKRARMRPAIVVAVLLSVPAALLLPQGLGPIAGLLALPLAVWRTRDALAQRAGEEGAAGTGPAVPSGRAEDGADG